MNWIELKEKDQIDQIKEKSFERPQAIFKHSTRCSISSTAKNRLDKSEPAPGVDFYFLDLIRHRELSNEIAKDFQVYHESPQLLLIRNGECIYEESHMGISMDELSRHLPAA